MNTSQRSLLLNGLDAIARERERLPFESEVLVLDNGSRDGSAQAARAHPAVSETIELDRRRGKAENDSQLLRRARGRFALLLNEDSELQMGATLALWSALQPRPRAACAGARLVRPDGTPQACAWRFPSVATALAGALLLHRFYTVQSKGERTRTVDWCQSSALLVRRSAAAEVGYLDVDFFVYSDEVDFARRLRDAGWRSVYVPSAVAIHHEQLSTDEVPEPRIVELARSRDLYMRKHHSPRQRAARALADGRPPTCCARSRRWCCPGTRRGATGVRSPRRCGPGAARECASAPRTTTASTGFELARAALSTARDHRAGQPATRRELALRLARRASRAVGTVGDDRVVGVAGGDDPGGERDPLAGESIRIAAAVPALVAGANGGCEVGEGGDPRHQVTTGAGVPAHGRRLGLGQRARLEQDLTRHSDLADVMQERCIAHVASPPDRAAESQRHALGQLCDVLLVRCGVLVLGLDRAHQRGQRRGEGLLEIGDERPRCSEEPRLAAIASTSTASAWLNAPGSGASRLSTPQTSPSTMIGTLSSERGSVAVSRTM